MQAWLIHLPVLPILIPLATAAGLLFIGESHRQARGAVALLATIAQLLVALVLLAMADGIIQPPWAGPIASYAIGAWKAPFGIVIVVDRLAAIMLSLTAILGLATQVYSLARWDRAGVHYLSIFQFLLMGLNGAFLTGDLFNLFVFFEILLVASYGLTLHGSGMTRVKAGLHYIVINLVGSLLFLVAVALIYGVTGTLNMAELPMRVAQLHGDERRLFDIGGALLGIVFFIKAGAWPLNFWLVPAYGAACAPVAAMFAIMTKVGIYSFLRIETLLYEVGAPAPFGDKWLFYTGIATIAVGTLGVLAAQQLYRLAGSLIIVSSGILLASIGFTGTALTGPALYYLVGSVLGGGAFFLLVELAERNRPAVANLLAVSSEAFGLPEARRAPTASDTLDNDPPDEEVGVAIPAAMAFLGLAFISCALLLIGLPPMSGFVAKFSLISAAINSALIADPFPSWLLIAALLLSGMAGLVAIARLGIRVFWQDQRNPPKLLLLEAGPVAVLLVLCLALSIGGGPAMAYFKAASNSVYQPFQYIDAVLPGTAEPAPEVR